MFISADLLVMEADISRLGNIKNTANMIVHFEVKRKYFGNLIILRWNVNLAIFLSPESKRDCHLHNASSVRDHSLCIF